MAIKIKNHKILAIILLLLTMIVCLFSSTAKVIADGEESPNKVYFKNTEITENDGGLIYITIVAEGEAKAKVRVYYHTEGVTALQGLDYIGTDNNIEMTIADDGYCEYRISIKCTNTNENRSKYIVQTNDGLTYGRYFNVIIDSAYNAAVDESRNVCKCYLPANHLVQATLATRQNGLDTVDATYFNDFVETLYGFTDGSTDIENGRPWRSWQSGVSFENDTTYRWVNDFINEGIASAYTSFVVKKVDDDDHQSRDKIHWYCGNKEMMENWKQSKECPGLYLYLKTEPCSDGGTIFNKYDRGYELNLTTMNRIYENQNKSPYSMDEDDVDVHDRAFYTEAKKIYWYNRSGTWYAGDFAFINTTFYRVDPYNGTLDVGIVICNDDDDQDRIFKRCWQFLTLVDDKAPTVVSEYVDDSQLKSNNKLRFYVRFNEVVKSTKKGALQVNFNNGSQNYYANYVEGNYTDTLVYELDLADDKIPKTHITSITYQLPNGDITDMAFNYDSKANYSSNYMSEEATNATRSFNFLNGTINLISPTLAVDVANSVSAKNIYNIMLSINDNGEKDVTKGTLYYEWSQDEVKENYYDTNSYPNSHIFVPEENGSIAITLVKNESEGINSGAYYLHTYVETPYGMKDRNTFGPYNLDGDPPSILQKDLIINDLGNKEYVLEVKNKAAGSANLSTITFVAKFVDANGRKREAKLIIYQDGLIVPELKERVRMEYDSENDLNVFYYRSSIDSEIGPLDDFILGLMGDELRKNFDIYFIVEDTAGNKINSNIVKSVYDNRSLFKVDFRVPCTSATEKDGYTEIKDIAVSYAAYDFSTAINNKGIVVEIADEIDGINYKSMLVDGISFTVTVNGKVYEADKGNKYRVTLTDLPAGFYEMVPKMSGTSTEDGAKVDIVADSIMFYLSDGKNDETVNRQISLGNIVLNNKVFQIPEIRFYYLDSTGSTVMSHLYGAQLDPDTEKYVGGALNPSFSSVNEAKKYIKFMEYQDLYLVKINPTIASLLNSGSASTSYVKAPGETATAQDGQLWIRYKINTWNLNQSTNAFLWAYYYYGSSGNVEDGININNLNNNLKNAINSVVNTITNLGSVIYLVTDEYLSQATSAPYLPASYIHVDEEIADKTKLNCMFVSRVTYDGDKEIYKNKIVVDNNTYPLATNMVLSANSSTRLFYKYAGEGAWNELIIEDGATLAQLFSNQATGYYLFREYGDNGISEFPVYFDKTLPSLRIQLGDEELDTVLDGTITAFTSTSFTIKAIQNEFDNLAYVAIYTYPGRTLSQVLYNSDLLANGGIVLTDNNYLIQVGDRSGNVVNYTVLLSNTELSIETTVLESQNGLIIQVLNREESEIYSYEVYLNERLITTEFSPKAVFKEPGIFRIVVRDIYGKDPVTKIVEYEFKAPEINWYYQNSDGNYAKYDSEHIVNMVIYQDENSSRISNVYTSTLLKMSFVSNYGDDEIEFEILDLKSGDYSYQESSNTISINIVAGFRLRVWYKNYPENDHSYVVRVDTSAPTITSNFIGTSHKQSVVLDENGNVVSTSAFSQVDLSNYNEGDYINLDTLKYEAGTTSQIDFNNDDVISGNRIVLTLNDPTGISSYSVTKDGVELNIAINNENQIIINGYGVYDVVAKDLLGNTARMHFINTDKPLTTAYVDGSVIADSKETFGNQNVTLSILYKGTNFILIKGASGYYTYVVNFDGNKLSYGRYICTIEKDYDKETGVQIDIKKARLQENDKKFDINSENIKNGEWYRWIKETNHNIGFAVIDGKPVVMVECLEEDINVELSYSVGNNVLPSYYTVNLSKQGSEIKLLTDGEDVEIDNESDYIYISGTLTIDNNINEDITKIEYAYAKTPKELDELDIIYGNGAFNKEIKGDADGFYRIVVTNKYKNQIEYLVVKVATFESIVTVTYQDQTSREFLSNEGLIYSNGMIRLDVYSDTVSFEVNNEYYSGTYASGVTSLELYQHGSYDVKVVNINGLNESFKFEINTDLEFLFKEEWISGYNNKALLKEQGYTNTILSATKANDVLYIAYQYNDEIFVLYDAISEEKILDEGKLKNSIGNNGAGEYIVMFKNRYGDLASKTIHYNNVPSLELSRKILDNQSSFDAYDLTKAIEQDFYSNYVLKFSTNSLRYEFSVDGNAISLEEPYTIQFENASGNGSFSRKITYLDEYGNYIEFDAILYRTDIQIDTSMMQEIDLNNILYTKDNIVVNFADNLTATVSVNNGEKKAYESGTIFYKDGRYDFVVEDIAGNRNKYTIVHKSVNQFNFTEGLTGKEVVIGGVLNNTTVTYNALDDSRIVSVFKNNKQVEDFNSNSFSTTGHWEVLIEDSIGNTSYAGFYVINNPLASFDYKTPFDYEISEVWYTDLSGQRRLLDLKGERINLTENGDYAIVVVGKGTTSSFNFSVTIDDTKPTATLVGTTDGGITSYNVTLKDLKSGDTVDIYRDGVLVSTTDVTLSNNPPEISVGGNYRVVITSVSGAQVEYNFTRKKVANVATSVFIIIACSLTIAGVTIGLLYHTRLKTDSDK